MYAPERSHTRSLRNKLVTLALVSYAVAAAGTLLLTPSIGEHAALLWLLALVPVLRLAYDRGLRGALHGLAAGGLALLVTLVAARQLGRPLPAVLPTVALACLGVGVAVGWMIEKLHRRRDLVEDLAFTDLLTGLPNRRHVGVFLQNEFAAAERGRALCVVLFDLDHFKDYNDTHGHPTGDEALRIFAEVLSRQTRRMNLSARHGGEEFLSVLAGSDLAGAYVFAERVRTALRARNLGSPPLTVSAGVAEYREAMTSPDALLADADRALYDAKRAGRNRVHVSGHPEFRLPAAQPSAQGGAARPPAPVLSALPDEPLAPEVGFGSGRRVLVVEDDPQVRRLVATGVTREGFTVAEAMDVPSGLAQIETEFDVVLVDILLPGASGDLLVKAVRARWPATQIIVVTGLQDSRVATAALEAGADRYLFKPFGIPELHEHLREAISRRDRTLAAPSPDGSAPPLSRAEASDALKGAHALVRAAEARERHATGHAERVAACAAVLAEALDPEARLLERTSLRLACALHDVGKISVSDDVLNKEGTLTSDELREVRQHAVAGRRMLEPFLSDEDVLAAAHFHHEWWDGSGYPEGRSGEDIPLVARVVAVAEGLVALTSPRAYRGALSMDEALAQLRALSGAQYDPALVAVLARVEPALGAVLASPSAAPPASLPG